ncbi:MAG TPA: hypothetical protein DD456_07655, partial [Stenotrophomonas sp.]|nr:hypothetical protein [Stenotrophomonas sp.]
MGAVETSWTPHGREPAIAADRLFLLMLALLGAASLAHALQSGRWGLLLVVGLPAAGFAVRQAWRAP